MVKVWLCALLCLNSVASGDVSVVLGQSGFKRRRWAVIGREALLGAGARGSNLVLWHAAAACFTVDPLWWQSPYDPVFCSLSVQLCPDVVLVLWDRQTWTNLTSIEWIHGPQRMKPTDFGDALTFPLAPPQGWHLWFWVKCLNNCWMDCHDSQTLCLVLISNC